MKQIITKIDKAQVTSLCADAISELERAVRLFPTSPATLCSESISYVSSKAKIWKAINDGRFVKDDIHPTSATVFEEEYYEFLEAAMKPGNIVAARIELVQAMAMLIRIGCHLNDYVPHRGTESTEVKS